MFTVVGNKHNAKKMAKVQKDVFRALLLDLFNYKITQWEVRFKSHQDHSYNIKTFFLFIPIVVKWDIIRLRLVSLKNTTRVLVILINQNT